MLNKEAIIIIIIIIIIIMEDIIVKVSSWIKCNCGPTGLGNYTTYKSRKKTAKAKVTNKMHNKVIKIDDNNLKWTEYSCRQNLK